jgi:hypothetical protein
VSAIKRAFGPSSVTVAARRSRGGADDRRRSTNDENRTYGLADCRRAACSRSNWPRQGTDAVRTGTEHIANSLFVKNGHLRRTTSDEFFTVRVGTTDDPNPCSSRKHHSAKSHPSSERTGTASHLGPCFARFEGGIIYLMTDDPYVVVVWWWSWLWWWWGGLAPFQWRKSLGAQSSLQRSGTGSHS